MLRRSRAAFGSGLLVLGLAWPAVPAAAEVEDFFATSECTDDGQCTVGAEDSSPAPPDSGDGSGTDGSGAQATEDGADGAECVYADAEFRSQGEEGPLPAPAGTASCETSTAGGGGDEPEAAFEPAALAEQARAAMQVPEPQIGTAPPLDKPRFVNMASWLWIEESDWEPVSATASVSAGSVTVTATPDRVVWDTGDGNEVTCQVPGTVHSAQTHRDDGSPDCGHTYTALPPDGPGGEVELTASWQWQVAWSTTDDRGGELEELSTSSSVSVPVSEIHSVITHTR